MCMCVKWSGLVPRGDAQGYLAYVLRAIDLLEKTNVIAVDKPQQHLTE